MSVKTVINQGLEELGAWYARWFHKRNLIIVSEHKVKHIPISGHLQFAGVMALAACVCWATYSTGSYLAAKSALREKTLALRSVANAKVQSGFTAINPASAPTGSHAFTAPVEPAYVSEPMFTVSALQNKKLASRLAYLEGKVSALQAANAEIIQRVQEKTSDRISDLQNIIKKTGLNADYLKKQPLDSKADDINNSALQGGPFIPADMGDLAESANALFSDLDEMAALSAIVSNLPLGKPMGNYNEQSGFGHRFDPFTNRLAFHSGLDMSGAPGSRILATADGVVTTAERMGAYGNMVDIDHGAGVTTRYGHMGSILVRPGQRIRKGDVVGIQGSTGRSTGAHLHYEVRYNDRPMNPKNFLEAGRYVSQN